ncbi:nitrite reductase [Parafrankia sp. EUN1f]|uniref:nitrite reductase n=1 Tax=Parafrankia sp. EUN1f TaxID=102897 RepID=UPI0001C44318|nr:nitrite reductase [Parafrankia sp. EUN1f]EFC84180.1 nitrite/sulfite reductase hemoprotein beta-component ferrodoxin domain protein [Parafrankia sp. EUN1f]
MPAACARQGLEARPARPDHQDRPAAPALPAPAARPARPGRADRCPGALILHEAADGGLARIRLPGGFVDGEVLLALTVLAGSFGEHGAVELTSRGNVQLRGVPAGRRAELAERVAELGLLPSATHERVRNIVAAPFAGLTGLTGLTGQNPGLEDPGLQELVHALDQALCADPELAGLSGRFLFGLDDASGDIAALAPDAWAAPTARGGWWIGPAGVEVERCAVVPELLGAARAFLRTAAHAAGDCPPVWRVRDLPDGGRELAAALRAGRPQAPRPTPGPAPARTTRHGETSPSGAWPVGAWPVGAWPVGAWPGRSWHGGVWQRPDGLHAAAVHVPLGQLTRPRADVLAAEAAATGEALRVTPWRSVVLPRLSGAGPDRFTGAAGRVGLVTDPGSPWTRVTTCAGRPGCASALADVRSDAARAVDAGRLIPLGAAAPPGLPTAAGPRAHWSGCARRCGQPASRHLAVVAGPAGYRVDDTGTEPKECP